MNVWNVILESNTFNFLVLAIIIIYLMKKLRAGAALENLKNAIIKRIDDSKAEKEKALSELKNAEKAVENLDTEIKERYNLAEQNADGVIQQTVMNAENQVSHILQNAENAIENEEKQISAQILKSTAEKALSTAKDIIAARLKDHPELHEKYINEAIEDIDRVKL